MRNIACFGDRTRSGTFFIIVSVSRTKITRSQGPITLCMLSKVLHLLVYSLAMAFCAIPVGFNFNLTYGLKLQVGGIKLSLFTNDLFFIGVGCFLCLPFPSATHPRPSVIVM